MRAWRIYLSDGAGSGLGSSCVGSGGREVFTGILVGLRMNDMKNNHNE